MKLTKYLDEVKDRLDLKNDAELGKLLGVGQNAISQYRSAARKMDNEKCLKVAEALGMDNPLPVIMAVDMDHAEKAGQHSLWEVFSARMLRPQHRPPSPSWPRLSQIL